MKYTIFSMTNAKSEGVLGVVMAYFTVLIWHCPCEEKVQFPEYEPQMLPLRQLHLPDAYI
jgi:hypothetical protein